MKGPQAYFRTARLLASREIRRGRELSVIRSAFVEKPLHTGYFRRPLPYSADLLRAALYNLYFDGQRSDMGPTEVEIHAYMQQTIGTFLPVEFQDASALLDELGDLWIHTDRGDSKSQYRLSPRGQHREEQMRRSWLARQWTDVQDEFGKRFFWLVLGVGGTLLTFWLGARLGIAVPSS